MAFLQSIKKNLTNLLKSNLFLNLFRRRISQIYFFLYLQQEIPLRNIFSFYKSYLQKWFHNPIFIKDFFFMYNFYFQSNFCFRKIFISTFIFNPVFILENESLKQIPKYNCIKKSGFFFFFIFYLLTSSK